jgi:hypothetical protein
MMDFSKFFKLFTEKKVLEAYTKVFELLNKGYNISVITYPIFFSAFFTSYEYFKNIIKNNYAWNPIFINVISAGFAGLFSDILTNPLWLVRTRV